MTVPPTRSRIGTFELAVALLILAKGVAVRLGLMAAMAFQLAVIPGVGAYGLVNLPVVAAQALLLRATFDRCSGRAWAAPSP